APKPTATETGERQTLSEDSVRYGESRDLHCRRQGKGNPQVAHFLNRASSEESFELTTELRGAFIADASGGSGCGKAIANHQEPGLVQPRRLDVLDRRGLGNGLEMRVKGRDAHAGLARQVG